MDTPSTEDFLAILAELEGQITVKEINSPSQGELILTRILNLWKVRLNRSMLSQARDVIYGNSSGFYNYKRQNLPSEIAGSALHFGFSIN